MPPYLHTQFKGIHAGDEYPTSGPVSGRDLYATHPDGGECKAPAFMRGVTYGLDIDDDGVLSPPALLHEAQLDQPPHGAFAGGARGLAGGAAPGVDGLHGQG